MRRIVFFIAGVGKPSFFPSGYFFREEAAPTFLTPYNCKKRGNENAQTGKILYLIEHLFTEEHPPQSAGFGSLTETRAPGAPKGFSPREVENQLGAGRHES
jgi:hypothetical protein